MHVAGLQLHELKNQEQIDFDYPQDAEFLKNVSQALRQIHMIGPELILGKIFDEIGFNQIEDQLFRHLVISRLVFPLSKLKTTEYLLQYNGLQLEVDQLYRYLDKLHSKEKDRVQQISFNHTKKLLNGNLSVVFYDVTTLYFEASDEDDLRKTGFSKEGKHQQPQILLGLLVSIDGYPLAYDIFEGNKFEGHTMLPMIETFRKKFQLEKLIIIADSGLLSNDNIQKLLSHKYEFILGARIKNESDPIKQQILAHSFKDGESLVLERNEHTRLIVSYASSRAKKDAKTRERGLKKLEKALGSGKLTKQHIHNRGYNKYLRLHGEITIEINYNKYNQDQQWDGLKGYITNSTMDKDAIIENYKHLWQIERAFRISKTDLRIRPVYHRLRRRIESHIIIAFCAYKLYKELERQLKDAKSELSAEKALEQMKTIYRLSFTLPESGKKSSLLFAKEPLQNHLLKIFKYPQNSD